MFPDPAERTRAIGIWTASLSGGIALGPVVGGLLLEVAWWGSVFLINVPVVAVLVAAVPRVVPEYRDRGVARMSAVDVVLSFAAILPIVWAVKDVGERLAVTPASVAALVGGGVAGTVLLLRQPRVRVPLIEVRLFAEPRFTGAVLGAGLAMFGLVGAMLYHAQYLQLVHGLSPLPAAVAMLPVMAGVGGMAAASPALAARFGHAAVFGAGAALAAAGMVSFGAVAGADDPFGAIAAAAVIGAGIAPMMTLATDVVVASAPPERAGSAAALSETSAEFGAALGIAVLGSIGTALYRDGVLAGLPAEVPAEAAEPIGSSLGAALATAGGVPGGDRVAELARNSFVDGLTVAAWSAAAILALAAVVCPLLLARHGASRRSTPSARRSG